MTYLLWAIVIELALVLGFSFSFEKQLDTLREALPTNTDLSAVDSARLKRLSTRSEKAVDERKRPF
jgi:hypothetical protein